MQKGTIIKGNSAYGCLGYKEGCDFKVSFDVVREKLKDQKLLISTSDFERQF
jgi:DNA topoisomerase-3